MTLIEQAKVVAQRLREIANPDVHPCFKTKAADTIASLITALESAKRDAMHITGLLEEYMDITGEPPDVNCSCHLSPPCNDCVENAGWREVFQACQSATAKQGEKP